MNLDEVHREEEEVFHSLAFEFLLLTCLESISMQGVCPDPLWAVGNINNAFLTYTSVTCEVENLGNQKSYVLRGSTTPNY